MFGKKRRDNEATQTVIAVGTRIYGDIQFVGQMLINGHVEGSVKAIGSDERNELIISERGCVKGSVDVPRLQLNGMVQGEAHATECALLGPKAVVEGNLQYKKLELEVGAIVNGELIPESEVKPHVLQESKGRTDQRKTVSNESKFLNKAVEPTSARSKVGSEHYVASAD